MNFATKLLIAGITLSLVLILGITSAIIVSRNNQTSDAALSNANNRAHVIRGVLQNITTPQEQFAAQQIVALPDVVQGVQLPITGSGNATDAVAAALSGTVKLQLPGEYIVVFNKEGTVVYSTVPKGNPMLTAKDASAAQALQGTSVEGVEFLGNTEPAYDVAIPICPLPVRLPVPGCTSSTVLGALVYIAPLPYQLHLYSSIVGQYQTSFVYFVGKQGYILRPQCTTSSCTIIRTSAAPLPAALADVYHSNMDSFEALYSRPGVGTTAGSFVAVAGPDAGTNAAIVGYVGVEVPVSDFAGSQVQDDLLILGLALVGVLVTTFGVLLFVHRFVGRPIAVLEQSVRKIAEGDLATEVPHISNDELGELADNVNIMRGQLSDYIHHIDASLTRLRDVSQALTTTTTGEERLGEAVIRAAERIVGEGSSCALFQLDQSAEGPSEPVCIAGSATLLPTLPGNLLEELSHESMVTTTYNDKSIHLFSMVFQNTVRGAIAVQSPKELSDTDARALAALANYAAIAFENTNLYEQERATVERLRELDKLKSDFLSTIQHEMRTPVMTIMGQSELMELGWDAWDDAMKKNLIRELNVYSRQLNDIVQTLVDFSLLSADTLTVRPTAIALKPALTQAIDDAKGLFQSDLHVTVNLTCPSDLKVQAEAQRFEQVIRAIVHNAIKFSNESGVIEVVGSREGNTCHIVVSDKGIGISEDALPHVFDQFYQENNSKTRSFGGMGMGLSLAQRLAEAQDATISIASTRDVGTTVDIAWPCATDS